MSSTDTAELLTRYRAACDYPGLLDEQQVEQSLAEYLSALGLKRKIVRLCVGWDIAEHPSLGRWVTAIIARIKSPRAAFIASDASAARDALDARATIDALAASDALDARDASAAFTARAAFIARDARDARAASDAFIARDAAFKRFAQWCIWRQYWAWYGELSYLAITWIGAVQLGKNTLQWARSLFEAFVAGCWIIHWTDDTLYWIAKPTVRVEIVEGRRQLHAAASASIESDLENLYFWHGVLVDAMIVLKPEWITTDHILRENNAEVRRIMLERYDEVRGKGRFIQDCGAVVLDSAVQPMRAGEADSINELLAIDLRGDPDGRMVALKVTDPSTGRVYIIRVPPDQKTVQGALAWSFDVPESEYKLELET